MRKLAEIVSQRADSCGDCGSTRYSETPRLGLRAPHPLHSTKSRYPMTVAKRTLMKAVINADTARAIVDACVEWQKAQPGNVIDRHFCALADR